MDWSNLNLTPKGRRAYFNPADVSRWRTVFPTLAGDFHIMIEGSMEHRAGLLRVGQPRRIQAIELNFDAILPGKERRVKASLQHELQHLVKSGIEGAESGSDVSQSLRYMAGEDEIRSHAKEAAYYFYELVPGDPTFDYNKLITAGAEKEDIIKYYYYSQLFMDPKKRAETIQKHSLDPEFDTIMKDAGEKFVRYVEWYLTSAFKVGASEPQPDSSQPSQGGALTLIGREGQMVMNLKTAVGKSVLAKQFGPDAQFFSEPQFELDNVGGGWTVAHAETAKNATLLNGRALRRIPTKLKSGDELAVGNPETGVVKLPMTVQLR